MSPRLHSSNFYNGQPKAPAFLLNKPINPNPANHCGKGPQEEADLLLLPRRSQAQGEGNDLQLQLHLLQQGFLKTLSSSPSNTQLKTFPSLLQGRVLTPYPQPCSLPQSHQVTLQLFYQATSNSQVCTSHAICHLQPLQH